MSSHQIGEQMSRSRQILLWVFENDEDFEDEAEEPTQDGNLEKVARLQRENPIVRIRLKDPHNGYFPDKR